jgi:hypothetical protein
LGYLCSLLAKKVSLVFPEANQNVAVGGFVFLRFICPTLLAADGWNFEDTTRRGLLYVTKLIQNLSNNVTFGSKEQFMVQFNGFIETNQKRVSEFLLYLSVIYPLIKEF